MTEPASPRDVFERLLDGITGRRWGELAELYAEDAVVEMPFAAPAHKIEGRAAVREHFLAAAGGPLELVARNIVVHETADPEVIVAEFDYRGRVTTTGASFEVANVQVLRVRDGRIVASRDYHDHAALAAALAGTALAVNLTSTSDP